MSEVVESWRVHLDAPAASLVASLWGKSGRNRHQGTRSEPTLLLQHLFDTLAVGEILWDEYLAESTRIEIDRVAGGQGRRLFAWLCGVHDLGKASPAFQSQDVELRAVVEAAGLSIRVPKGTAQDWRHEKGSGLILYDELSKEWDSQMVQWVWPLAAGHHGAYPSTTDVVGKRNTPRFLGVWHGADEYWLRAQRSLLEIVTEAVSADGIGDVEPAVVPSRATQLALSGLIVMADWVASNDAVLGGVGAFENVSMKRARERARSAIDALGLGAPWKWDAVPDARTVSNHVGRELRPLQAALYRAASDLPVPGLMICEAPTGEGKTEAAFAAAEVLAARFGSEGIFVALPTQATSDSMFIRTVDWIARLGRSVDIGLVHSGKLRNVSWVKLRESAQRRAMVHRELEFDDEGLPIDWEDLSVVPRIGGLCEDCGDAANSYAMAASEWFDGRNRGLLAHTAVGTIDQLLFAGTRTKHVMVRFAGLAGKVVIIDEVHAVDEYMAVFLGEVLAWLGLARVPVVVLSATLSPTQRQELIEQYLKGATGDPRAAAPWASELSDYPSVTSVWAQDGNSAHRAVTAEAWRPAMDITVEVLNSRDEFEEVNEVAELLSDRLGDGGCALVIRNTVARAQATFDAIHGRFDAEQVVLLHGRLTSGRRAELTSDLVERLGLMGDRPERLVVVATQVAEQSFDVDLDLLVTDHAPIDLLIQRCGRMHRHDRPAENRPPRLREPCLIVTGLDLNADVPWFPPGSEAVYGRHLLLRSAASLAPSIEEGSILLPDAAPTLVADCYGHGSIGPERWKDEMEQAELEAEREKTNRVARARECRLVPQGQWSKVTLEGLHDYSAGTEDNVRVRDGDMGVEVALVVRDLEGYRTIEGNRLGIRGERASVQGDLSSANRLAREVVNDTVRLPGGVSGRAVVLNGAAAALGTLPEWHDHPLLRSLHVLELDERLIGELAGHFVTYDLVRGLEIGVSA